jgi:hypothetical protein
MVKDQIHIMAQISKKQLRRCRHIIGDMSRTPEGENGVPRESKYKMSVRGGVAVLS